MSIKSTISAAVCLTVISFNADAVLEERLGGLAYYDTEADITWLADASYLKTLFVSSGGIEGDEDGRTNWAFADNAVSQLNVAGVTGWRLPTSVDIGDDGCNTSNSGTDCGFNMDLTSGEMVNLFTNTLNIEPLRDTNGVNSPDWIDINKSPITSPFSNILSGYYWSGTQSSIDSSLAFVFSTFSSNQVVASKTGSSLRTWPVHPGDVGKAVIDADTFSVEPSTISTNQSKNITYLFCFENSSGQDATSVEIVSDIPVGSSFVEASGSYSTTSSEIIWSFGPVPVGQPRQCVSMVVNVLAAAGSALVVDSKIQSDRRFIPDQVKTAVNVVAPAPASDEGGGVFGLLELFIFLMSFTYRRAKTSKT